MLHANAATLRGQTYYILWLIYDVVSGNHNVLNSPWGEGESIASARPRELHFCVIWGYHVQHLTPQKVYKIET